MADFCQVCHRPLGGASGVGAADESALDFARTLGVNLENPARICVDCLQRYMKGTFGLADVELITTPPVNMQILAAAQGEVFVSDAPAPVGVFDLGHVGGYNRLSLGDFTPEIVRAELQVVTLMKNLTLARGGDGIYHFRINVTGAGNVLIMAASGSAGRTGKRNRKLEAAWKLFGKHAAREE